MNIYIPLAIFFILLAFFTKSKEKPSNVVFTIMMLVSMGFAAVRFEFGPDYFQYRDMYERLDELGVEGYLQTNEHIEALFLYFLHSFPSYELFIAVQSILWFGCVYLFLRNRMDTRYLWLVIFLLYFDVNNILNNYVAIRTSFVGILFLIALPYLKTKKIIYILLLSLAFFIHNSSAPLLLLALFKGDKIIYTKIDMRSIAIIIGAVSFFFGDIIAGPITDYIINLFPDALGKYSYYMDNMFFNRSISLGNFVFLVIKVFIVLMLLKGLRLEKEYEYVLFYKIAILIFMLSILFGNMIFGRINMNIAPLLIVIYIRTLKYLKKDMAFCFVAGLMVVSLFAFYNVINSEYSVTFLEYHSILSK